MNKIEPARCPLSFVPAFFIQFPARRCLCSENVSEEAPEHWSAGLYEARAAELLLYGRALGLSHAEAQDVLQETFITLLERPVAPSKPGHYAIRTFRNRVLNYRRSMWRRLARELESHRWFEKQPDQTAAAEAAMRHLRELPVEQREVIVLKIWHHYTFEEIGELLETSPNTIAGRYRYGLQKMRNCLKEADYERDEPSGNAIGFLEAAAPVAKP